MSPAARALPMILRLVRHQRLTAAPQRSTALGNTTCLLQPCLISLRSFSSSSSSSDEKTVEVAKAEVEKAASASAAAAVGAGAGAETGDTSSAIREDQWGNRGNLIYEGSIAHQVRSLKRVSIMTSLISILGVPALVMFGNENVPMAGQVAVMSTALAGTGTSTLLLSLCVSPYVFRMAEIFSNEDGAQGTMRNKKNRYGMLKQSGRRFRAERMNIFGVRVTTEFSIDDVEPMPTTSRPFVSFKADGKYYFIQGHDMADKELLTTLFGRELKDHEKESTK